MDRCSVDTLPIITADTLPIVTNESYYGDQPCSDNPDGFPEGSINTLNASTNYALVESGKDTSNSIRRSIRRGNNTLKNFREASSLSVSMLAKPSDDRKSNTFFAGWNVSTLIQGTGTLGIPYAVQQGGWAAVAMIFFVSIIFCYSGKLIVECMYEKSKKTGIRRRLRTTYPEVAEAVTGRKGFVMISILVMCEMFGAAVMFIILLGTTCEDLFRNYLPFSTNQWAAINCAIMFPTLFITKMSVISWFSMVSVFALMSSLITLITFCFFNVSAWSISNIPAFNPQTFPVGFGIIVFSYCANPIFPSVEGSMKKPEQFKPMMNVSFLIAAIIKAVLGAFMVLTFGAATNAVATINLVNSPIFSKVATSLITCSVACVFPLEMFIVNETIDEGLLKYFPSVNKDSKYHWVWMAATRPFLLLLALALAILVPHFGLLMGVLGSLSGTFLCFFFPCYCHIKLRWDSLSKFELFLDVAIIVFGLIAGGCGFVFSTKALVMTYL